MISLILGGAASGRFARARALAEAEPGPRLYLAAPDPADREAADRVARRRAALGPDWTSDAPVPDLAAALAARPAESVALVDDLSAWLADRLRRGRDPEAETAALVAAVETVAGRVVLVSAEMGLDLVPMSREGRAFRDAHGRLNQRLARVADHVEFVLAGLPLPLKGAPPRP